MSNPETNYDAPRETSSASSSEIFLGAEHDLARSWLLNLSEESRGILEHISGKDPLAESVILQGAMALLLYRYGMNDVRIVSPPLRSQFSTCSSHQPVLLHFDVDENLSCRDWLIYARQVVMAAYRLASKPEKPVECNILIQDCRVHRTMDTTDYDELCFSFAVKGASSYRVNDPAGILQNDFPERLEGHLNSVLSGLANLECPIAEIRICNSIELSQLRMIGTGDSPKACKETFIDFFRKHVNTTPNAPALIEQGMCISYASLESASLRLANHLIDHGKIEKGDTVAVAANRSIETVVNFLGTWLAGGAIAPFDPLAPAAYIASLLENAKAKTILLPSEHIDLAFDFPKLWAVCQKLESSGWTIASGCKSRSPSFDDVAAIIFTSGTEGHPKGVILGHEGLANTIADHVVRLQVNSQDRCVQFMAPFFDGGLLDIFTPLAGGGALLCPPSQAFSDPGKFHEFLSENEATLLTATPAYLAFLDPSVLPKLRVVVSAAELARAVDFRRLAGQVKIYNGYGPTEASVNTSLFSASDRFQGRVVPIGRPSSGKKIKIVDSLGRVLPQGVVGEIEIGGIGLAFGYLGDRELTNSRFNIDPNDERTYRTGDLGAWGSEGELYFLGRKDKQVKIGGRRVELGQIEQALFEIERVHDAAVIEVENRLVGFFVTECEHATAETTIAYLHKTLPKHMIPAELHKVERITRKANGKLDIDALVILARAKRTQLTSFRAQTETEVALLEIWRDALQIQEIDEDADFFRLGGDSIRIIQAVQNARNRGIRIEAADLIDHRTLRSLASAVDARTTRGRPPTSLVDLSLTSEERAALPEEWSDAFPVSAIQKLMLNWYEEPIAAQNGIYHCFAHWRLRDNSLCHDALILAGRALARRHPCLRTSFTKIRSSGKYFQSTLPMSSFVLRTSDLTTLDSVGSEKAVTRIASQERTERFHLDHPNLPFSRIHLVFRTNAEFDMMLSAHHAVIDGWSNVTMENDFAEFYKAAKDQHLALDEIKPGASYREFVSLDKKASTSNASSAFWRERWRRIPNLTAGKTNLVDRPLFARLESDLDDGLLTILGKQGSELGVSPKAACLSAFLLALRKQKGELPVIGVVANGRTAELSDPIGATGLFWNIVPFVPKQFAMGAEEVQHEFNLMASHETYPLGAMLANSGRDALFDICFNFIQMHHEKPGMGGIEELSYDANGRRHFGLTLHIDHKTTMSAPKCNLRFEYRRDRWTDESILRLISDFPAMLHDAYLQ